MRLIGSRLERIIESEIKAMSYGLFHDRDGLIVRILQDKFGDIHSAYAVIHTPDQDSDIFVILVNGEFMAALEVSRIEDVDVTSVEVEKISIREWRKKERKRDFLRNEIALKLAEADKKAYLEKINRR